MNELEEIKKMYYQEDILPPTNLKERYNNLALYGFETTREKFLIMICNDFLIFGIDATSNTYINLNKEMKEIYSKLSEELKNIRIKRIKRNI